MFARKILSGPHWIDLAQTWGQRISLTPHSHHTCSDTTLIRFNSKLHSYCDSASCTWQFQDCGPRGQCPSLAPWLSLMVQNGTYQRATNKNKRYDTQVSWESSMVPCPLRARGNKKGWGDSRKGLAFKKLFFMTTAPLLDWGNYASELLGERRNEAVFTFLKVAGTCWNYFTNWGTCRTVLIVEPYKSRNGGDDLQDYTDYYDYYDYTIQAVFGCFCFFSQSVSLKRLWLQQRMAWHPLRDPDLRGRWDRALWHLADQTVQTPYL